MEIKLGRYRHYKGKDYKVFNVATHSETMEKFVVYQTLYGDYDWWIRPFNMFTENIEINGKVVPRFEWISED